MALISSQEVSLGFGGPKLIDGIDLQIERGEAIGLLGRNGAGKSTLLKLINGDLNPASGRISRQQGLRSAYLPQEVPQGLTGTIAEIIASGLEASNAAPGSDQHWQEQLQIDQVIARMQLDPTAQFATLSAGMKRRVLLARGLVRNPEILLLDEPTNHLDIAAINWLEDSVTKRRRLEETVWSHNSHELPGSI
jgi:ABC transport system ATP-binding/permease protein